MSDTGTRIRRGDTVRVTAGKDKGKEGKVIRSFAPVEKSKKKKPSRLLVEGINIIIKHKRAQPQANISPAAQREQSGRIEMEAPIYTSKVAVVCPNCGKATRIGVLTNEAGDRFRACKECGKSID
jgi:large subunit ribosomal protein L24